MQFVRDPSLVFYLPLYKKDGGVIYSEDAYGHLCTVTGATWGSQGRDFDGDDSISVADAVSLRLTSSITINAWVKLNVVTGYNTIVYKGTAFTVTNMAYAIDIGTTENIVRFLSRNAAGAANIWSASFTPVASTWYNVVFSYDGVNNPSVYVNGVFRAGSWATGGISNIAANTSPLLIGRDGPGTAGNWVDGIIGEVQIFNRALTPIGIQNNYLATKWRYR